MRVQKLTEQQELLIITMEECGELTQACSKVLRNGMSDKNYDQLVEELGDVQCLINLILLSHLVSEEDVDKRVKNKVKKLTKHSSMAMNYLQSPAIL